jgi:hypothetical protein
MSCQVIDVKFLNIVVELGFLINNLVINEIQACAFISLVLQ